MDFMDECVAELRLHGSTSTKPGSEPGNVTGVTSAGETKTITTGIDARSRETTVVTTREMSGNQANSGRKRVTSTFSMILAPATKGSQDRINSTGTFGNAGHAGTNSTRSDGDTTGSVLVTNGHVASVDVKSTCPVCRETYTDPRVLPCLHSACLGCIYTLCNHEDPGTRDSADVTSTAGHGVLCPVCEESVELPASIESLPANSLECSNKVGNGLRKSSIEMYMSPVVLCSSCCEKERAVAIVTCFECGNNLCQLCTDSHRRQKKTSRHTLLSMSSLGDGATSRQADDTPGDVVALQRLLQEAVRRKGDVEHFLDTIPSTREQLRENAQTVTRDVGEFIDSFITAVEKHRNGLLNQIRDIVQEKEAKLNLQEDNLGRLLNSFENGCSIADDLSSYGTDSEIASLNNTVSQRLNKLMDISTQECVSIEPTVNFCPEVKAEVLENFQMFGRVIGSQVCHRKCHVTNSDLTDARVDAPCCVTVVTKDTDGTPFPYPSGLRAWIGSGTGGCRRQTLAVKERENGAYDVRFVPKQSGAHQLHIAIDKHDVQGSPFSFVVKSKWRKHTGTWQCCSFCSSGGRMDVTCGCGSVVRGCRGCWHAHPGYPGGPHWTCCGKMSRQSECIYSVTKDNSNVMEVTL